MTTSKTEELKATAQYEAFKQIPMAHRTQDMQNVIDQYEQDNGITNESEITEVTPPVVLNAPQEVAQEQNEVKATRFQPSSVPSDPDMFDYFCEANKFISSQLPLIKDERNKNVLVFSGASSIGSKWSRHKQHLQVNDNQFALHVANKIGCLSFSHIVTKTTINKAIKEERLKRPYITVATATIDKPRNTQLIGIHDDEIKCGNEFIVHITEPQNAHTDDNILMLKDIFEDETIIPESKQLDIDSSSITGTRYLLSKIRDKNIMEPLIEQLKTICPPEVKENKYNGWTGILAMALLTSQEHFEQMWELMIEKVGTEPLEKKYKLAVALELIIPIYETMLEGCNVTTNQTISTTLVKTMLKGVGYSECGLTDTFAELGFPLKEYKSGIPLTKLKLAYEPIAQDNDKRIQSYRKQLNT